jgi:tRNA G18 (ribose-2'-O)-methylase SpoU
MTLRENIHGILSEMAPPATGAGGCSSVASTAAAPIPPVVIDLTLLDSTRTKNPRSTIGQDTRGGGDGQLAVIDETVAPQLWESSILLRSSLPARLEMGACVVGGSDAVRRIWKQHGVKPNVVYLPDGANEVPTWCQERATSSTSSPALVVRALGAAIRTELLSAEHSDGVAAEFPLPAHNPAPLTQLLEYPTSPEQRLRRVLVVHQVRVPGNLGSILRAAEQLQFDAIVLDRCCDPTSEKVLRESGGALYSSRLKVFLLSPSGVWRRFAEEYQQPRLLKASSESSSAMPVHDATTNNDSRDATQAPDAAGSPSNPRGAAAQGEFHQQTSHPSRQYIASAAELLQRAARAHGLTPFVLTPDQTADSAFELAREFHEHAADLKAASIGHGSAAVRPEADGTEAAATATADAAPGAMLIVGGESAGLDHLLREWDARLAAVADPNEDEDNEDHESEHAYDDDLDDEIVNETSSGSCLKGAIPRGGGAGVIDTEVNTHSIRQDDVSASSDIDDDETEVGENGHNDDDDDLSGAAVASVAYVPMCLRMDNPLVQSLNVAAAASAAMHHFRPAAAVEHARLRRRWKIAEGKAKIANSGGASSGLPSY